MNHSFNVQLATKLGIEKAIIIENIIFWRKKDKANDHNYHDGRHWVYNSSRAFADLFPYMTARTIKQDLKELVDEGYLHSGNYNQISYDRTLWYSPTDLVLSIVGECTIDCTKWDNGQYQSVPPIPVIIPSIIPVNNNVDFEKFYKSYPHFRAGRKQTAKEYYLKHSMTPSEIEKELLILKWKNYSGISKVQFNHGCYLWIRDLVPTNPETLKNTLMQIVNYMRPQKNYEKNKELLADFPDIDIKSMFNAGKTDKLNDSIKAMLNS